MLNRLISNDDPVDLLRDIARLNASVPMRKGCIRKRRELLIEERRAFAQGGVQAIRQLREYRKERGKGKC